MKATTLPDGPTKIETTQYDRKVLRLALQHCTFIAKVAEGELKECADVAQEKLQVVCDRLKAE